MAKSGPPNISYPGLAVVSLSDAAETSSARGCVTSFIIYYEWKQKNVLVRSSSSLLQPGMLMAKAIVTSLADLTGTELGTQSVPHRCGFWRDRELSGCLYHCVKLRLRADVFLSRRRFSFRQRGPAKSPRCESRPEARSAVTSRLTAASAVPSQTWAPRQRCQ